MKKVVIIGAGFSGLSAASFLATKGHQVKVLEKHDIPGGRARKYSEEGYTFDMGPSWYWMPDVFERFFQQFGKQPSDYYALKRLDPAYKIFFGKDDQVDVSADIEKVKQLYESIEEGAGVMLEQFLKEAKYKYEVGMQDLVYKPALSVGEFAHIKYLKNLFRLQLLKSFESHSKKYFKNDKLLQMVQFPILFLGGTSKNIPALYSLMNYSDLMLGTWYPQGGMYKVVDAMYQLALSLGVEFEFNADVSRFNVRDSIITEVETSKGSFTGDRIISSADYHFTEQTLLDSKSRTYSEKYWDRKTLSPSSLIYYLGVDSRLDEINHHNLFFDEDFSRHANEIYHDPQWPSRPSMYVCATSKSDHTVAPKGHENLMLLIPIAPGLEDSEHIREKYFKTFLWRYKKITGRDISEHIVYKRSYAINDFQNDYNAYKGNAYGLANTLRQTAILRPSLKSKKVKNLYYAGQLTVPGPGVPPAIISGEIVANEIAQSF